MIEAVTATVSNSQLVRQVAEQTSTTQSFSSNPTRVQAAAITAPYLSPHVDLNAGKPIFVVRDAATGENIRQFPTEGQIKAYQQAQAQAQTRKANEQAIAKQVADSQGQAAQKSADIVKSSVEFHQARQEVKQQQTESVPGQKTAARSTGGSSGGSTGTGSTGSTTETKQVITSLDTQA